MYLRYLLHETQAHEIVGRQQFLYDIFHLYFIPWKVDGEFITLTPVGNIKLSMLFITGHANRVIQYIQKYIDTIQEDVIVATTCFPKTLCGFRNKKIIFVPNTTNELCFIHKGEPYGFSFDITDAELDFYNAVGSIIERIQAAYCQLNKIAARWPVMAVAQFYFIGN